MVLAELIVSFFPTIVMVGFCIAQCSKKPAPPPQSPAVLPATAPPSGPQSSSCKSGKRVASPDVSQETKSSKSVENEPQAAAPLPPKEEKPKKSRSVEKVSQARSTVSCAPDPDLQSKSNYNMGSNTAPNPPEE